MHLKLLAATALLLVFALVPTSTQAQTATTILASYSAGWNMVGGPPGTDFSVASDFYAWGPPDGYVPTPTRKTALCTGYWALFRDPARVALNGASVGPTQSCPLYVGWNLIGNPFGGLALLPAGMTAWRWNPIRGAYDTVNSIPTGGSVFIYSDVLSSVTLTYAPDTTRTPVTVTVSDINQIGPFTLHVGDSFKLVLPLSTPHTATADPAYLGLEGAGEIGDMSCIEGPSCAIGFLNQYWLWQAIAPGTTSIQIACYGACTESPVTIGITILP